jgi:isopenicillin N synthase-like dioxygenase
VVAPSADAAARGRMTVTFFHQPNWDTVIAPLATCVDADRPPRHAPITSAAHYAAKVARLEGQGA